ncbi:hypothetical protein V5799_027085 [Amblyomma americanum]|uniref:Uncharacterized protein n=1 Tax=Amblyomma americanum TaxID=6943 RepID=A0AAQ4DGR0_AMBAM
MCLRFHPLRSLRYAKPIPVQAYAVDTAMVCRDFARAPTGSGTNAAFTPLSDSSSADLSYQREQRLVAAISPPLRKLLIQTAQYASKCAHDSILKNAFVFCDGAQQRSTTRHCASAAASAGFIHYSVMLSAVVLEPPHHKTGSSRASCFSKSAALHASQAARPGVRCQGSHGQQERHGSCPGWVHHDRRIDAAQRQRLTRLFLPAGTGAVAVIPLPTCQLAIQTAQYASKCAHDSIPKTAALLCDGTTVEHHQALQGRFWASSCSRRYDRESRGVLRCCLEPGRRATAVL